MPWTHCDDPAEIADDSPCPGCGLTKAEWTIELDRTRTFAVRSTGRRKRARDAWIELELVGADGAPVPGADYRVALPNGRVKKGQLDEAGRVRLEKLPAGDCEVSFPSRVDVAETHPTGAVHRFVLAAGAADAAPLPAFIPSL